VGGIGGDPAGYDDDTHDLRAFWDGTTRGVDGYGGRPRAPGVGPARPPRSVAPLASSRRVPGGDRLPACPVVASTC
jgi:hypothetical protein